MSGLSDSTAAGHDIAIIGGTGLTELEGLTVTGEYRVETPWGASPISTLPIPTMSPCGRPC